MTTPTPSVGRRRPATHQIASVSNLNANIGKEATSGIDLALRYGLPTRSYGRFHFVFDGTWLKNHDVLLADGRVISGRGNFDLNGTAGNFAGFGGVNPAWKFNAGVLWGLKNFGAGVRTKVIGSFKECGDSAGDFSGLGQCYVDNTFQRKVDAYSQWDVFMSYAFASAAGRTTVGIGVNNLFDANPAVIYNGFTAATDPWRTTSSGASSTRASRRACSRPDRPGTRNGGLHPGRTSCRLALAANAAARPLAYSRDAEPRHAHR